MSGNKRILCLIGCTLVVVALSSCQSSQPLHDNIDFFLASHVDYVPNVYIERSSASILFIPLRKGFRTYVNDLLVYDGLRDQRTIEDVLEAHVGEDGKYHQADLTRGNRVVERLWFDRQGKLCRADDMNGLSTIYEYGADPAHKVVAVRVLRNGVKSSKTVETYDKDDWLLRREHWDSKNSLCEYEIYDYNRERFLKYTGEGKLLKERQPMVKRSIVVRSVGKADPTRGVQVVPIGDPAAAGRPAGK